MICYEGNCTNGTSQPPTEAGGSVCVSTAVIMLSFAFIGIVGNAFVFHIFGQDYKQCKSSSTFFILMMAVVDLFTCAIIIPWTAAMGCFKEFRNSIVIICYQMLATFCVLYTSLLCIAISIDRYFAVCKPLMFLMTMKRSRIVIFVAIVIAILFSVITVLPPFVYYATPGLGFALFVLTVIITVTLYINVWVVIFKRMKAKKTSVQPVSSHNEPSTVQQSNNSNVRKEKGRKDATIRTACIMFLITIVFIVTWIPSLLYSSGIITTGSFRSVIFFNNLINPLIYLSLNKRFKSRVFKIVCCKK